MRHSKMQAKTSSSQPHRIAVTFSVASPFGGVEAKSKILPEVYPTQKLAMSAVHVLMNGESGYMAAQPVPVTG